MLPERLVDLMTWGVGFDTETHLIQPGLLAPPLVCAAVSWLDPEAYVARQQAAALEAAGRTAEAEQLRALIGARSDFPGELMDKMQGSELFAELISDKRRILATANGAFDMLVMAARLAVLGIDCMPELFQLYEEGRVYDVQIAEALHAIAQGHLNKDPRTGGPLINPETGRRGRYALATCVDLCLGRTDAKMNDEWREKYALLDGIPMIEWPESARIYPLDDTRNTLEVALAQAGHVPKTSPTHRWTRQGVCVDCGATGFGQRQCWAVRPHRNLHDLANQVYTAWAMHLGAAWGFRVNQSMVDIIEREALRGRDAAMEPFKAAGFLRTDGTQDLSAAKRAVARAYGATQPCPVCNGSGKVPSPKAPLIKCPTCKGASAQPNLGIGWAPQVPGCATCRGAGKIRNPKTLVNCATFETPVDKNGHPIPDAEPIKVKTCDGTGLLLPASVPRSEKEGVSYGRDVLNESGDETLMALADFQEDAKDLNVYVPYLRTARRWYGQTDTDGNPILEQGQWVDVPLTLWPNVLLDTGRTSYGGVIQLFKRQPGYVNELGEYIPSLRECIEARPGTVFSSEDYDSGELVTHAQSCIWIVGDSALARALVDKVKPHNAFGATMIGMSYKEFQEQIEKKGPKVKICKDARQAAKPANFGYPGGMGDVKLVLQQRKQGPDTPHASGPTMIKDPDTGMMVKGYKGLRFCILMDNAPACGIVKVTEHRDRPIPPTCKRCIECAARLKDIWLRQWPENERYFGFINTCMRDGMWITDEALNRWPHLRPIYGRAQQLSPGEVMQHVSGRIRGGLDYCSAANGFFQGLLADIAKSALRRVARECYDHTVRVVEFAHANSERSKFAGGQSPLYGSRPILFAHDEIIFEHPETIAHEAATRVSEIMVEEMRWYCPNLAPACKAEPTLMRRWFKGAEKVIHHGRLVPWEPSHNPKTCADCKAA